MITDGLTVLAGSGISLKLLGDRTGSELPVEGAEGDLFELISSPTAHGGIYEYTATEGWVLRNPLNQLLTYDISGTVFGSPNPGDKVLMFAAPRSFDLLGDMATATAVCLNPADRTQVLDVSILRNEVQHTVGSIQFEAGKTRGVYVPNASNFPVFRGDMLIVFAPFDVDPLFSDISFTISGYLPT